MAAVRERVARAVRGAEDRANKLEAEIAVVRERAARAEGWLQTIHKEIEEKLIAPLMALRSDSGAGPSQVS
jgi:hypothetical protein